MNTRPIALLTAVCLGLFLGGCESLFDSFKPKSEKHTRGDYEEVLMPAQTGSTIQRRTYVQRGPEKEKKKTSTNKKKPSPTPKPKPEATPDTPPSPSPTPEEESTPAPERFR